jgi:hypothetical protein
MCNQEAPNKVSLRGLPRKSTGSNKWDCLGSSQLAWGIVTERPIVHRFLPPTGAGRWSPAVFPLDQAALTFGDPRFYPLHEVRNASAELLSDGAAIQAYVIDRALVGTGPPVPARKSL